jgi:hypothetical protein
MSPLEKAAPYAKAIIAALVSFLTAIATALDSGGIDTQEWITAVVALLVAGGAVFSIPNRPPFVPEPEPTPSTRSSRQRGA